MGLVEQNTNKDKSSENLKTLIITGLKDMEEGRAISVEEAFNEIDEANFNSGADLNII